MQKGDTSRGVSFLYIEHIVYKVNTKHIIYPVNSNHKRYSEELNHIVHIEHTKYIRCLKCLIYSLHIIYTECIAHKVSILRAFP